MFNNLNGLKALLSALVILATSVAMAQDVKDPDVPAAPVKKAQQVIKDPDNVPAPTPTVQKGDQGNPGPQGPQGKPGRDGYRIIVRQQVDGTFRAELESVKSSVKFLKGEAQFARSHIERLHKTEGPIIWGALTRIHAEAQTAQAATDNLRKELVAKGYLPSAASTTSTTSVPPTTTPKEKEETHMGLGLFILIALGICAVTAIIVAAIGAAMANRAQERAEARVGEMWDRSHDHADNVWNHIENTANPFTPAGAAGAGGAATTAGSGVRGHVRTNGDGARLRIQTLRERV
jgi:hypothetical protein